MTYSIASDSQTPDIENHVLSSTTTLYNYNNEELDSHCPEAARLRLVPNIKIQCQGYGSANIQLEYGQLPNITKRFGECFQIKLSDVPK